MRGWLSVLVLVAVGCRHPAPPAALRPAALTVARVSPDLPPTKPTVPNLDAKNLPKLPPAEPKAPSGDFHALTESDCLKLGAANSGLADALDEENRVPTPDGCDTPSDRLRRELRYYTALGFRNQAAAEALDRFFQLSDVEARSDILRQVFPITDAMLDRARKAKAAGVRFPFEPADLEQQRSQLVSQLEQAEHGSRLLNLDLKRRIGLPHEPEAERLWPVGEFVIDPEPVDASLAVNAAITDRPELRGLRALRDGLSADTLPDVRDVLRAGSPLLGGSSGRPTPRLLERIILRKAGPTPATLAEIEVRRKQLTDMIADQERLVADEALAAALAVNAQRVRATRARDRLLACEEKLAEAVKKREANQPGAEFLEPQARVECLKARAEVVAEVAAWHQARVRLRAAQGWLAWEALK